MSLGSPDKNWPCNFSSNDPRYILADLTQEHKEVKILLEAFSHFLLRIPSLLCFYEQIDCPKRLKFFCDFPLKASLKNESDPDF